MPLYLWVILLIIAAIIIAVIFVVKIVTWFVTLIVDIAVFLWESVLPWLLMVGLVAAVIVLGVILYRNWRNSKLTSPSHKLKREPLPWEDDHTN